VVDGPQSGAGPLPLWSVTVTVAGPGTDVDALRAGLDQLLAASPFISSVRYCGSRVELRYWDEARDADDAAAMALRLWTDHRPVTCLPEWPVVGVEVVDRATVEHRAAQRSRVRRPQRRPREVRALDLIGDIAPW